MGSGLLWPPDHQENVHEAADQDRHQELGGQGQQHVQGSEQNLKKI